MQQHEKLYIRHQYKTHTRVCSDDLDYRLSEDRSDCPLSNFLLSRALFILCHHLVSVQFLLPAFCFSPYATHTTLLQMFLSHLSSPFLPPPVLFLPFSLCRQGVGLKPSREERLPSTRANICPALNWANMDKANTISFSVPGCLPCCPFIPFLSVLSCCRAHCWLTSAHTMHMLFLSKSLAMG